jgi:PemK-like, MazF-like toxin of type II toxin-antitoxin system
MLIPMAGFRDLVGRALQAGLDLLNKQADSQGRQQGRQQDRGGPPPGRPGPSPAGGGVRTAAANERAGAISYQPDLDGAADPGEVVWTWVPYEEDASQGKDRPVLVVARGKGGDLLGLMLSSQGHRRDDAHWLSVGSGPWDREGRESFVRLDRVLEIPEDGIRREGAIMPAGAFEHVAGELRSGYGWR